MFLKEVPALDSEFCFEYYFFISVHILHKEVLNSLWLNYSGNWSQCCTKTKPWYFP